VDEQEHQSHHSETIRKFETSGDHPVETALNPADGQGQDDSEPGKRLRWSAGTKHFWTGEMQTMMDVELANRIVFDDKWTKVAFPVLCALYLINSRQKGSCVREVDRLVGNYKILQR
jgi:hypothetical protein